MSEADMKPEDLRIEVFRNAVECQVKITHLPSGWSATGHDPDSPRSYVAAKAVALTALKAKMCM